MFVDTIEMALIVANVSRQCILKTVRQRGLTIKVVDVVAAALVRRGLFLIAQRPINKTHGGKWEFPGGKLEPGESLSQALEREIREELGVHATPLTSEPVYTHIAAGEQFRINFMLATFKGEPSAIEHSRLKWVSPAELSKYEMPPSDRAFRSELTSIFEVYKYNC